MAKSGKRDSEKGKKDNLQVKPDSGSVVKAKDKRKKTKPKKVMQKLAKDITNSDNEFRTLRSNLVSEKENEKTMSCKKDEQPTTSKVPTEVPISQEKKVEETTQDLACL